jgi:predicted membrane protein
MRRKLLRIVMAIVTVQVIGSLVGLVVSKRMSEGDENSDEFKVAAIFGGKKFRSRARSLRSGVVVALIGGIDLDLRDATLAPEGAKLELRTTMGGIQVTVPQDWAVDVDAETQAGGFEVNVTPPVDLPEDAPNLRIHAVTRMGGGAVTAKTT